MITYIEGKIINVIHSSKTLAVEVFISSGIGYKVHVPLNMIVAEGEEVKLFTSFQVREDSQTIFGFSSRKNRDMFENILSVSGIGPKVALSIVSTFSSEDFKSVLMSADYNSLSKVKGLGQKGAKKIVLELQGIYVQDEVVSDEDVNIFNELKSALQVLGFKGDELKTLVEKGKKKYNEGGKNMSIEGLMSYVLKND